MQPCSATSRNAQTHIEPTVEQMDEVGRCVARLPFQDWLCLIVARQEGHACLTNDVPLGASPRTTLRP